MKVIDFSLGRSDLANKLFCLQLARWIVRKRYGNKTYFYACFSKDPFDYVFYGAVHDKDSVRRKVDAGRDVPLAEAIPQPVRDEAIAARSVA